MSQFRCLISSYNDPMADFLEDYFAKVGVWQDAVRKDRDSAEAKLDRLDRIVRDHIGDGLYYYIRKKLMRGGVDVTKELPLWPLYILRWIVKNKITPPHRKDVFWVMVRYRISRCSHIHPVFNELDPPCLYSKGFPEFKSEDLFHVAYSSNAEDKEYFFDLVFWYTRQK
ncbi:hypothetical protein HDU98_006281 [Podochytrium sp. JEL0797]|nr:hypothetical protein HDU98_006281 [Podochytrium sp. JEL0797]